MRWTIRRLVLVVTLPLVAGASFKRGRLPEGHEREMLRSFASQAAVAMRNARLFADDARLYEEAQQRVRELLATQPQLVQAAKLSAVGQLVSGAAHELNNPLSVVIGYGQLLLSRACRTRRSAIEAIVAQGARMAKIVQSLMLFSRQCEPKRRPVDLGEVIQQILALRDTQLAVASIPLETELDATVPPVQGDPTSSGRCS